MNNQTFQADSFELASSHKPVKRCANFLPMHIGQSFQQELTQLVESIAPVEGFKGEYLRTELLSKYCDASTTPADVRASAALTKWLSTEDRNARTNQRVQLGDVDFGYGVTSDNLIGFARQRIAKVLGRLDPDSLLAFGSHSNGASTRIRRSVVAAATKCTGEAHVSQSALPYWSRYSVNTKFEDQTVSPFESSVLFTVPKSTDIDRVACKEPELNMLLQRCVGSHIRDNLRRFGIDLRDQTRNQDLARQALSLDLATIDLSSASDSITNQLVFELLPIDWYFLLDDLRVKSTILPDGSEHFLEMFSSMGNGFTFELESLIFWALTQAICYKTRTKGRISVYGDDIICSRRIAPFLAKVFGWFGFKVNSSKSNWTGLFRESCGKHYYNGSDVTPFYIREPVKSKTDVIRLLNRLLAWDGRGLGCLVNQDVISFHLKWSQSIPQSLWGGVDPDRIDSLVTGHLPRSTLRRTSRKVVRSEEGSLVHWFSVKEAMGSSRLSYDSGQWSYPSVNQRLTSIKRNLPFDVSDKIPTKFVIEPVDPLCDNKGTSYREGTTWTPWLLSPGVHRAD